MDVDGSAERRGPAAKAVWVWMCFIRTNGDGRMRGQGEIEKERIRRSRYMVAAWKKDRRVPVADPGRDR